MKKAFWLLALGALASAVMAASIGRAEDKPVGRAPSQIRGGTAH
ncbi:hypothetical protein [Sphingobium algorifonticola]|nr:hypothetical protein [Sphingobium algorifonticola]